jgi:hypothetical protein
MISIRFNTFFTLVSRVRTVAFDRITGMRRLCVTTTLLSV